MQVLYFQKLPLKMNFENTYKIFKNNVTSKKLILKY